MWHILWQAQMQFGLEFVLLVDQQLTKIQWESDVGSLYWQTRQAHYAFYIIIKQEYFTQYRFGGNSNMWYIKLNMKKPQLWFHINIDYRDPLYWSKLGIKESVQTSVQQLCFVKML